MNKTIYKLTDENLQTRGGFQYKRRRYVSVENIYTNAELCSPAWLHAYADPLIAVLMSPVHGVEDYSLLWEARWRGEHLEKADKLGVTEMALWKQIEIPKVTSTQRQAFAILTAKQVYHNQTWNEWTDNWLSGKDRSVAAASAAAWAASAASAAASAAAWAARAAASAAAWAASAAASAAAWAASAAASASAWASARAAEAAAEAAADDIDLVSLAHQSVGNY